MNAFMPLLLGALLFYGFIRQVDIYQCFVSGAEEGIRQGLRLTPYLLAILFPVYLWNKLGITATLCKVLSPILKPLGLPEPVLPLMLMRPLSGGASLGILTDIFYRCGPDSTAGLLASVYQGGTDTTFFVITVYFGSVGIRQYSYALKVGLYSDLIIYLAGLFWLQLLIRV
jgi:spore maturation protein B